MDEAPELRLLFHRLNNQLGIILAHAELLEAKAPDDMNRARAAQVVSRFARSIGFRARCASSLPATHNVNATAMTRIEKYLIRKRVSVGNADLRRSS